MKWTLRTVPHHYLDLTIRIFHANFGVNRIRSLGARAVSTRKKIQLLMIFEASLPAVAVIEMISLNFKFKNSIVEL